uniref:F-actin-capping protein subunit alpha n=1 Tax=Odontella aurita TaxID=265563 RepID=A0A6U6CGT5_9STRA|mmetsp:Transcript_13065/g.38418  ORF Transcript_13065/g.38418 Transcript_13065/m.38418 type:complete len:123 (-) Transcript_13065:64-432(-)
MEMSGVVDLVAHSFENGNVQMRSSIPLGPVPLAVPAPADTAASIVLQIQRWEDADVQSKLGELYDSVNNGEGGGMLKSLRRIMPVTRTRMDWKNAGVHRLARTMAERGEQQQQQQQQVGGGR